jgi:hypothetical protein
MFVPSLVLASDAPPPARWLVSAEEREEGGRVALGCTGDGGRRGGSEKWALGSGVERSGDETQRKVVGSAGSAVSASIVATATRRNCAAR